MKRSEGDDEAPGPEATGRDRPMLEFYAQVGAWQHGPLYEDRRGCPRAGAVPNAPHTGLPGRARRTGTARRRGQAWRAAQAGIATGQPSAGASSMTRCRNSRRCSP